MGRTSSSIYTVRTVVYAVLLALLIVCGATLAAFANSSQSAKNNKEKQYVLEQMNAEWGPQKMWISRDAVKIVSTELGFELVAKAPTWEVVCFRPDLKSVWRCPLSKFQGLRELTISYAQIPEANGFQDLGVQRVGATTYRKYADVPACKTCIWALDEDLGSKPPEVVCRYLLMSPLPRVPLIKIVSKEQRGGSDGWFDRRLLLDERKGKNVRFDIKSITEQPYQASDYVIPTGCKLVADARQVMLSHQKKEQLDDLIDNLGFAGK